MKLQNGHTSPNVILEILGSHWEKFKGLYPSYNNAYYDDVVSAVFNCADPKFGFKQYACTTCGKDWRIVAFSCKSRFCLRCGRVNGEQFALSIKDRLHPDVSYRHLILTIPEQLRTIFYNHRHQSKLYSGFFKAGWDCVQDFVSKALGKNVECGCLVVMHVVGRTCQYKPHLHILMMSGGIDKNNKWEKLDKFPYKILHQSWKICLLKMFKRYDKKGEWSNVLNEIDEKYPKGFVARIEKAALPKNSDHLLKYISKYLCKPHISLKRIKNYDSVKEKVSFEYSSHKSKKREIETTDVMNFIGRLVQQILPKRFQRVRYFGLQANKNWERLKFIVSKAVNGLYLPEDNKEIKSKKRDALKYRDLVMLWWRKDPFECRYCGGNMELVRIWKPGKGFIYSLFKQLFGEDIWPLGVLPEFCNTA